MNALEREHAHGITSGRCRDTDLGLRRFNPSFYGYIPGRPSKRFLFSVLLFVICITHIVGKTSAMALLFVTNRKYLLSYVGVDMGVYLFYKILRRDFYCWVPRTGIAVALIYRIVTKLMVDFTGLPQLRCPLDLGGACWAATMATTQVMCLVSSFMYCREFEGDIKLQCSTLMTTMGTLGGVWALAIAGLLLMMERKYVRTFFSFQTAAEYAVASFSGSLERGDDEGCFRIFSYNEALWTRIRPDVKSYLERNVDRLFNEKPEWLTPGLVASIDSYFLPDRCRRPTFIIPLRKITISVSS
jgi:hypothetical protein